MVEPRNAGRSGVDGLFAPVVGPPVPDWFVSLTALMSGGTGIEDRLRGVVHARTDDDGGHEFTYRVQRRGHRVRCSTLTGEVHVIAGRTTQWMRAEHEPGGVIRRPFDSYVYAPDDYDFGLQRPGPQRWRGDDFTTPTGPPEETTFLGRPALVLELAPPPRKPYPLQLTVERGTGLILRQANRGFGTFAEWAELDTDADLADDLFAWQPQDRAAERYG